MLIDFSDVRDLFVTNSSFKYPARHITTWENMYNTIDANNKTQTVKVFNQTDYIICRTAQKSILQDARSYAGTEMSSDNCLVVTKKRIQRFTSIKRQSEVWYPYWYQ